MCCLPPESGTCLKGKASIQDTIHYSTLQNLTEWAISYPFICSQQIQIAEFQIQCTSSVRWHFVRWRPDRLKPNHVSRVRSILHEARYGTKNLYEVSSETSFTLTIQLTDICFSWGKNFRKCCEFEDFLPSMWLYSITNRLATNTNLYETLWLQLGVVQEEPRLAK